MGKFRRPRASRARFDRRDHDMRIVVKVGTSTLAHPTGRLNIQRMEKLCKVLSDLKNMGHEIILVSSGAIAMGFGKLNLSERPKDVPTKQASAAVGQCELMYIYDKLFTEYNHTVAQLLITAPDIEEGGVRKQNFHNTLARLLELGALPVINENDTIAVEQIKFGDNDTLAALAAPTRISGRVTAELEMAPPGKFEAKTAEALGKEAFSKAADAEGYEIVVDTHGTLLWGESAEDERPLLILTSEQGSKEYLAYLNGKHISWIACGKEHVDLKRACEILAAEFDVKRAAAVGGGHINAGFLAAGLLDEVSILIGAGIAGRGGMQSVFDGLPMERGVTPLKLTSVQQYGSGAVWLRYNVEK